MSCNITAYFINQYQNKNTTSSESSVLEQTQEPLVTAAAAQSTAAVGLIGTASTALGAGGPELPSVATPLVHIDGYITKSKTNHTEVQLTASYHKPS